MATTIGVHNWPVGVRSNRLDGGIQHRGDEFGVGTGADGTGPGPQTTLRLNPTQQTRGFAGSFAWGLRGFAQMTCNNVFDAGMIVKPTVIWFEDTQGIAQQKSPRHREMPGALMFPAAVPRCRDRVA